MNYTIEDHKAKKLMSGENISESVGLVGKIKPETIEKLTESAKGRKNRKLIVQMEAIHVGRTANYTFYTEEGLKEGLDSWTHPYSKPVLTHHNTRSGEPIGRILKAEFSNSTMSGRKGLVFTCEISDAEAVEKVLDKRYDTVSIGATTDRVTCNICGTDRTKEWCEHFRGDEYEGQTCHYTIGTTFGREVSYVNVPADENARNFSVSLKDDEDDMTKESAGLQIYQIAEGLMQNTNLPEVNLYESASDDVKKLVDGLLELDERSESDMGKNNMNDIEETSLEVQLKEAQTEISNLENQLSEAQTALSSMVVEKTKVDSMLEESQEEINNLTANNASLTEAIHKSLAEKVVDMKLSLRKSDVVGVDREEAVEEHIKRTKDSLEDAVKDLQVEMESTNAVRGSVGNPGEEAGDNNPNKKVKENKEKENITVEEAVGMFKGMFARN